MRRTIITAITVLLVAGSAWADPFGAVTITEPVDADGAIHQSETPLRYISRIAPDSYVENEYFMEGAATVYTYNDPPVRGEIIVQDADVPYKTRFTVRKPADPADFNGTVIIEWLNSTAGFDTAPVWDASAEYFTRAGWIYVGVTNATNIINFLVNSCPLLGISIFPETCGTRYSSLYMSENGQAFEMLSQLANLLRSGSPDNPLNPDYSVQRVFHAGQSQQGGSMVTYASAFHEPTINDGYFVQAAGTARRINYGPVCGATGSPAYPDCTPSLTGDDRLVATDLDVPVYRALTETDVSFMLTNASRTCDGGSNDGNACSNDGECPSGTCPEAFTLARQTDSGDFRYYELAGTSHVTVHRRIEVIPEDIPGGPLQLDETCASLLNTLADGPVLGSYIYNSMWQNMEDQVRLSSVPPGGSFIDEAGGVLTRDAYGNVTGGIRMPQMDHPLHSYFSPHNTLNPAVDPLFSQLGSLFCVLAGSYVDLDAATLNALYASKADFAAALEAAGAQLETDGFLLAEDAALLPVPPNKDGQSCINAHAKAAGIATKARGKLIGKCIKDTSKGKAADADACIAADAAGFALKADAKADKLVTKSCATGARFADPGAAAVSSAAGTGTDQLLLAVFGTDSGGGIDDTIVRASDDKDAAKCQAAVYKGYDKMLGARVKTFARCAKSGLSAGEKDTAELLNSVGSALQLTECLFADPKNKVAQARAKLLSGLQKKCLGVDRTAAFPGDCDGSTAISTFGGCLADTVELEAEDVLAWANE